MTEIAANQSIPESDEITGSRTPGPDVENLKEKRKRTNPEKVRKAAAHPSRPGAECKAAPGKFVPLVNRGKCEGKGDCVEVCPYDVFDVTTIAQTDFDLLSWFGRLKVKVHGMKTAYTPRADQCLACGLCVVACPEKAIQLVARV